MNIPIDITIRSGTSANNYSYHGIIICGVRVDSSNNGFYTIMDPNYSTYRSVTITPAVANGSSFYYPSNSGTYTAWVSSFY